jgi:hypothetical protein
MIPYFRHSAHKTLFIKTLAVALLRLGFLKNVLYRIDGKNLGIL